MLLLTIVAAVNGSTFKLQTMHLKISFMQIRQLRLCYLTHVDDFNRNLKPFREEESMGSISVSMFTCSCR
jgi:hypothetical protein